MLHIPAAIELVGLQNARDTVIERLHHAIAYGWPRLGLPVLHSQRLAQLIELVVAVGVSLLAGKEAVPLLAAISARMLGRSARVFVQCYQHGRTPALGCNDPANSFRMVMTIKSG